MKWLNHLFGRPALAESWVLPRVEFIGEQNGHSEQEVKARWKTILNRHPEVQRAYLALAAYDHRENYQPVLCIPSMAEQDVRLVDELAEPFKDIFARDCALDIVFLTAEKEEEVRKVCRAFHAMIQPDAFRRCHGFSDSDKP